MLPRKSSQNYFVYGLTLLCLSYLLVQCAFNAYTMFSVDEFWFAHRSFEYKDHLPYRDFAPYKTVFGYYLLLIPMLASQGVIGTLLFTKNTLALLNAIILFGSSLWLRRYFSSKAILTSLLLLLTSEVVLSYSTNIRVDLFAYWLCFFSLLLLLEKRYIFAGLLLGLGFCTSQKAIWYLFASNCALGVYWLAVCRDRNYFWSIVRFNLTVIGVIGLYIICWSLASSPHTVITSLFSEAAAMYQLGWYNHARKLFWSFTLIYNPFLFLLWPLTLSSLFISYQNDRGYYRRLFITIYSFAIFFCLIPYKQVFPYYMQVTIPVFFILYASFFNWLFVYLKSDTVSLLLIKPIYFLFYLTMYMASILFIISWLQLPAPYLLITIIPIGLGIFVFKKNMLVIHLALIASIFVGLIYPLILFAAKVIHTQGDYQKANIEMANIILKNGGDYLAGIDLIYNKSQPIVGMKHLMGPAIDYLYQPSATLRAVMLASLDEDPNATKASVIADLEKSSVKLYINNYRIRALPIEIRQALDHQYEHLWGSIYIYSPTIDAGTHEVHIKFSGNYQFEDGKSTKIVTLKKGMYHSESKTSYRLKLIPEFSGHMDNAFQQDNWEKLTL